jgi:hypothetical protein
MVQKKIVLWMLFGIALFTRIPAHAQDLDGSPLASCPAYEKDSPVVSNLAWSVNCFLQAIYDENKNVFLEFDNSARCQSETSCDGALDAYTSELVFGLNGSNKAPGNKLAVSARFKRAKSIMVAYYFFDDFAEVTFIIQPSKKSVRLKDGIYRDFFRCRFRYNAERKIWEVAGPVFGFETDRYIGDGQDPREIIDLTGKDSELPPMIWKPKLPAVVKD